MMARALIGYTGFVGSTLDRSGGFSHRYNSANFRDLAGMEFDEVVCAGVQAVKWWANRNPEADWAGIAPLIEVLETVRARRFVLISTVDVYALTAGPDEATPIVTEGLHPYGLHRYRVEQWVRARHPDHAILRLPGLYGPGIKKNLIFDVLSGRDISAFHPASRFQFYDLSRLAADIAVIGAGNGGAGPGTVNLAVEPVSVAAVLACLGAAPPEPAPDPLPDPAPAIVDYDIRTRFGRLWGQDGPYLGSAADSLAGIAGFADAWRAAAAAAPDAGPGTDGGTGRGG